MEKKLKFLLSATANERAKRTRAKDSEDTPPPSGRVFSDWCLTQGHEILYSFTSLSFCSFIAVLNKRRVICKINLLSCIFIEQTEFFPVPKILPLAAADVQLNLWGRLFESELTQSWISVNFCFTLTFWWKFLLPFFCFSRLTSSTVKFFPNISVKQHLGVEK